jgi:hypothetical protein
LPSDISTAKGISRTAAAILKAVAGGEITAGEAVQLASVLEVRRKAIETQQLESRVADVERAVKDSREER